jgi:hypothetical protein
MTVDIAVPAWLTRQEKPRGGRNHFQLDSPSIHGPLIFAAVPRSCWSSGVAKKNTTRIEPGDTLVLEVPVAAIWPDDGKVTVSINGTRFTFAEDNPEIRDMPKKAKERDERGQKRIREVMVFDDARAGSA